MSVYRLTLEADRQLTEIWRYTAGRWGVRQADDYLAALEATCEKAAATPSLLRPRADLSPDLGAIKSGSHMVFARIDSDGVLLIVSILHGAWMQRVTYRQARGNSAYEKVSAVSPASSFARVAR